MTTEYKLWIGLPGRFPAEVDRLMSLLNASVAAGESNIYLSPERSKSFDWICDRRWTVHEETPDEAGWVSLQTSGTTGQAKWVRRRFDDILAKKRGRGAPQDRWLLCYNPARWAGFSVLAHVFKTAAQLVVPRDLEPRSIADAMPSATHLSLTPSMFRKLLLYCGSGISAMPVRQLTFGGEYASQKVLDDARKIWPQAHITHVYATTELGDICAVDDGNEGLPQHKLRNWQITEEGELMVDAHATGDLWEQRGDRLIFSGRREEVINVGGAKVHPARVEAACIAVADVVECRAYAVKNALLGEVVGLDYVGSIEPQQLRALLLSAVPKFAVPAKIDRLDALPLSAAGKILRRALK